MEESTGKEKAQTSSNEAIYNRFRQERVDWSEKMSDMSNRLRDIGTMAELLTDVYSQRQICLEYSHEIMSHLIKVNKIYREKRQERFDHYTRNFDLRLDKEAKYEHISYDLTEIVERREMLENHLNFLRETVKSIDNIGYGIKHRIALEEYRRT